MKSKLLLIVLGVVVWVGCTPTGQGLRIGLISYQSLGGTDVEGFSTEQASALAAAEINQAGGVQVGDQRLPLQFIPIRIDLSPESAVDAVKTLVNREQVVAIVGPSMSAQAIPAGAAAEAAQVPLLTSVASNPAVTKDRRFVFRLCFTDLVQGQALADFARTRWGGGLIQTIFNETSTSSRAITEAFEQAYGQTGGRLAPRLAFVPDRPEFATLVAKADLAHLQAIFLPNESDYVETLVKLIRQAGFTGRIFGGDGWDREKLKALPEFEGTYMTTNYFSGQNSARNQAFVQHYQAQSGRLPGDTAALTYDAVYLLAAAIRAAGGTDSQRLHDALVALPPQEGVAGVTDWVTSGDPQRTVVYLSFHHGQVEAVPTGTAQ